MLVVGDDKARPRVRTYPDWMGMESIDNQHFSLASGSFEVTPAPLG